MVKSNHYLECLEERGAGDTLFRKLRFIGVDLPFVTSPHLQRELIISLIPGNFILDDAVRGKKPVKKKLDEF